MNHSPRALSQRTLVWMSVITLNTVAIATVTNCTVVWKSNNIIFTLNLLTTNLMNNVHSPECDAKIWIVCVHNNSFAVFLFLFLFFFDVGQESAQQVPVTTFSNAFISSGVVAQLVTNRQMVWWASAGPQWVKITSFSMRFTSLLSIITNCWLVGESL